MTLDEFFSVKAPSNYVEAPITSEAEVFKKPTPKPEVTGVQTAPVSPKVEQIKKIFSSAPAPVVPEQAPAEQVQPQQPTEQFQPSPVSLPAMSSTEYAMAPTSDLVDMEKIRSQAEKMVKEPTWGDFLTALTPLAVEAIAGGGTTNVAPGISGDYLMRGLEKREARKASMEDKLMEIQKARLLKKRGGGMQSKPLRDKLTGQSVIGSYDPYTDTMYVAGNPVDTSKYELAPGLSTQEFAKRQEMTQQKQQELGDYFGRGVRVDPDTGLLSRVVNGRLIPIQIQKGQLNPKQTKDLDKIIGSFKTTDVYKKNIDTVRFAGTLKGMIQEGNPTSLEMAKSELAKAAEGGGRLTNEDVERLGGSRAIKEKIKRFAYLQKTGKGSTPDDTYFMSRIADILEERAKKNLSQSVVGMEKDFMQKGGILGAVQTAFNPYIPGVYDSQPKSPVTLPPKKGMVVVEDMNGVKGYMPQQNLKKALESKKYKVVP